MQFRYKSMFCRNRRSTSRGDVNVSSTEQKTIQDDIKSEDKKVNSENITQQKKDGDVVTDNTPQLQTETNVKSSCSNENKSNDSVVFLNKDPDRTSETHSTNQNTSDWRSRSSCTRRNSRSPVKPASKQDRSSGAKTPTKRSQRSPALPSPQSRSSRPVNCNGSDTVDLEHSHTASPHSSENYRKRSQSRSSSRKRDSKERSQDFR